MVSSAGPFPDADFEVEWVREDSEEMCTKASPRLMAKCGKWKAGSPGLNRTIPMLQETHVQMREAK